MENKMNYIRELLLEKEQNITSELDKKKIANLKFILKNDDAFFNLDLETAIGILAYLGVPETSIKDLYFELISPESYKNNAKTYTSINSKT